MHRYHLVSLGCAKNQVDSELMLASLAGQGWQLEENPAEATILIVNTCGFLQSAVEEAIEEILGLAQYKEEDPQKLLVVAGCMVQRYKEMLVAELPEVDLFLGTEGPASLGVLIAEQFGKSGVPRVVLPDTYLMHHDTPRTQSTPAHRAWMKVTEGCDNRCSYCLIPSIRGNLRSRPIADLLAEAKRLEENGVKEVSLIAQDSTAYGNDLKDGSNLLGLVAGMLRKTSLPWIRLLYLYPTGIGDDLLQLMAQEQRLLPYFDVPFQHVNSRVLQLMNRRYGIVELEDLIARARRYLPEIALRTTFLVGFPGETEAEFLEIEQFMRRYQLDHVGVFAYENEEGSRSEKLAGQIDPEERQRRRDYLMSVQAEISAKKMQQYVGQTLPVLVEGVSQETDLLLEGRTVFQAPEVDGVVYINDGVASAGDIVQVEINEAQTYDLVGGIVVPQP